jgi:2-dehydro-3-deoxygluconokinase
LGNQREALAFAAAASAWKHLVVGDFNLATAVEIQQVVDGDLSGRLLR